MHEKLLLLLKFIILALIQGITEILPISSSGHLIIFQTLFQLNNNDLIFEIFLHFASLIAIIIFFKNKLIVLIKDFLSYLFKKEEKAKTNFNYCLKIIIATLPSAIVGLFLKDTIERHLSNIFTVGICLIITSFLLYITSKIKCHKEKITFFDSLIIGLFQCLGIIPGISRSGSCIIGGLSRKIKQNESAEFSFILAIPIMLGSSIIKIKDFIILIKTSNYLIPYLISFIITFLVTFISLKLFLKIIRKQKLSYFSLYCLIIGLISLIYAI